MIWVPIFCVFLFRGINFSLSEIVSSGGGFEYLLNSLKWFSIFLNDLVSFEYLLSTLSNYRFKNGFTMKKKIKYRNFNFIENAINLFFFSFLSFFLSFFFFFFFLFFFVIIIGLIFNIFNILQIFKGFLEIKQPIIHINIFLLNIY